jgi:hypothetical protein
MSGTGGGSRAGRANAGWGEPGRCGWCAAAVRRQGRTASADAERLRRAADRWSEATRGLKRVWLKGRKNFGPATSLLSVFLFSNHV